MVRLRELAAHRDDVYGTNGAGYRRADHAVRAHILEMAGNALLADLYRGFVDPLRAAVETNFDDSEVTRDDPDRPEMPDLVRAIEDRDPDAAAARHMDNALRVLRLLLQVVVVRP